MGTLGTIVVMPLLIPFCRMMYQLLKEKEYKIKESMKMMGLTDSAYFASWLFHYLIIFTFISVLSVYMMCISIWTNSSW